MRAYFLSHPRNTSPLHHKNLRCIKPAPRGCTVITLPQALSPLGETACDHVTILLQNRPDLPGGRPRRRVFVWVHNPGQPFRCPAPGTTRKALGRVATALPRTCNARVGTFVPTTAFALAKLLLGPHSQSASFESPRLLIQAPRNHPGSRRPSRISDKHHHVGHVARRYSRRTKRPCPRSRKGAFSLQATPWPALSPGRSKKHPVTDRRRLFAVTKLLLEPRHILGIVSYERNWQALSGLSWLSYSRSAFRSRIPERS